MFVQHSECDYYHYINTLKNGQNGKCYVIYFTTIKKTYQKNDRLTNATMWKNL